MFTRNCAKFVHAHSRKSHPNRRTPAQISQHVWMPPHIFRTNFLGSLGNAPHMSFAQFSRADVRNQQRPGMAKFKRTFARTFRNNVREPHMKMWGFEARRARKFTRTSPRTLPWNFITMLANPFSPYSIHKRCEPQICPKFVPAIVFGVSIQGTVI